LLCFPWKNKNEVFRGNKRGAEEEKAIIKGTGGGSRHLRTLHFDKKLAKTNAENRVAGVREEGKRKKEVIQIRSFTSTTDHNVLKKIGKRNFGREDNTSKREG